LFTGGFKLAATLLTTDTRAAGWHDVINAQLALTANPGPVCQRPMDANPSQEARAQLLSIAQLAEYAATVHPHDLEAVAAAALAGWRLLDHDRRAGRADAFNVSWDRDGRAYVRHVLNTAL
jgi:hypothetical protein